MGQALVALTGLAVALFIFGFIVFASHAMREVRVPTARADGIVVLTGGEQRIEEAARLLSEGRADRLLISGVNMRNSKDDLRRIVRIDNRLFDCCVDLGYTARDTIGNASETRRWAEARRYRRLIVVTSSFHMPRSLVELSRALPQAELVPYPVLARHYRGERWWLNPEMARKLFTEYLKYLPSVAILHGSRLMTPPTHDGITAAQSAPRRDG